MSRKEKTSDLDRERNLAPGLVARTKKRLVVAGGRSHLGLAAQVATALGTELVPTEYRTFASGEILTRFEVSIRGCDLFLVQSFGPPVNEWLMELLIMLDAAKRASAKRITVATSGLFAFVDEDVRAGGWSDPLATFGASLPTTIATCVAPLCVAALIGEIAGARSLLWYSGASATLAGASPWIARAAMGLDRAREASPLELELRCCFF